MLDKLTYSQFLHLIEKHNRVAVFYEIAKESLDPVIIFQILSSAMPDAALLEIGIEQYSFIGLEVAAELSAKQQNVSVKMGEDLQEYLIDPIHMLRNLTRYFYCETSEKNAGFIGGAFGFLSYDAVRLFEDIPEQHVNSAEFPDLVFRFYKSAIIFDHQHQTVRIYVVCDINELKTAESIYNSACTEIEILIDKINYYSSRSVKKRNCVLDDIKSTDFQVDVPDEFYIQAVNQAKAYIEQGDAFQIVLSRCFSKKVTAAPFDIYQALRVSNPAPYMFYFQYGGHFILGASPEKLVNVKAGKVQINPLAGTCARNANIEDESLERELLQNEKEVAEHMMLVDLARNDIGAVCKPGTVSVAELMQVKKLAHVMHLSSEIVGELNANCDIFDVIRVTFPAGTLTGAPKVRAMEIIDELEVSRRGMYGGIVCMIDNQNNLESCIAIRMATIKNNIVTVRAGAGVVFDSNPQAEADETRQKAKTILTAIAVAERGVHYAIDNR